MHSEVIVFDALIKLTRGNERNGGARVTMIKAPKMNKDRGRLKPKILPPNSPS
jgi:hypothetical protein